MKSKIKAKKKPKTATVSQQIKRLDVVYSRYIRQKDADFSGQVSCFTCGSRKHWSEQQCGHYVSRSVRSLRFYDKNTQVQCVGCNIFKHGALDEYALALQNKYGEGVLKELNKIKNQSKKYTVSELEGLIVFYSMRTDPSKSDYGL